MIDENDVGVLLDRLRPYLANFASDVVAQAGRLGQMPTLQPATVVDTNTATGVIDVMPDGGGVTQVPAASLIGMPEFGSRVMLLYQPPAGVFVVGYIGPQRQPHVTGGLWQRVIPQAIPGGTVATVVTFDTEIRDSDGFLPVPGSTFTVAPNLPGRYLFTAMATWAAPPPGRMGLDVLSSSYPHRLRTPMNGGGEDRISVSGFYNLNVGESIQVIAFQSAGGPIGISVSFEAVRLLD